MAAIRSEKASPQGFEPSSDDTNATHSGGKGLGDSNATIGNQGGAQCGAVGALNGDSDADLQAVIATWPRLSTAVRAGILAMVKAGE